MAAVEAILEKLRRAAAHRGPEWLRQQVGDIGDEEPSGSRRVRCPTARGGRGLRRVFRQGLHRSPFRALGVRGRCGRSPPVKRRQDTAAPGRSIRRRPNSGGGATGQHGAGSLPGESSSRLSPSVARRRTPEGTARRVGEPSRALEDGPRQ